MSGMILTINLEGSIGGFVKHKDLQKVTVQLSKQETVSKTIKHTNRSMLECSKVMHISEEVIEHWEGETCPQWEEPRKWKKMSKSQRLFSYLEGFDEGLGFSFEFVEQ